MARSTPSPPRLLPIEPPHPDRRPVMNIQQPYIGRGEDRCPAATTQEIIAADQHKAPGWVTDESYRFLGDDDIPANRYIEADYQKEEFKRMWTRTWQWA